MSFSTKRPSNTKTVKILAYCVLQVGIYEARAHQKWTQMWIWWNSYLRRPWCRSLLCCSCAAQSTKTTRKVVVLSGAEEYSRSTSAVRSIELLEKYWFCLGQRTTEEMILLPHSTRLLRKWLCCFGQITIREVVVLAGAQDYSRSSCSILCTRQTRKMFVLSRADDD